MKKLILLTISILCIGLLTAQAEGLVIKGGANFTQIKNVESKPFGYQFGVGFQTEIPDGFGLSFQPELVYKIVGFEYDKETLKRGYLEIPINVQLGVNIGNADTVHPFVFAGPYVGIGMGIFGDKTTAEQLKQDLKALEYGLGIGVGIDLWILQLTAKYNWNFGRIADATQVPQLEGTPRIIEICVGLNF